MKIFLVETATDDSPSVLTGAGNGLVSAGFRLTHGASDPSQVLATSGIAPNGLFDSTATLEKDAAPGSASLREDVDLFLPSPPVQGTATDANVVSLWLGTFRFTVQAVGTTNVSIGLFGSDPQFTDFMTAAFEFLDSSIQPGSFTITANGSGVVPEPSTMLMAATAALGLVPVLRRRASR